MRRIRWIACGALCLWSGRGAAFDSGGPLLSQNKKYTQPAYSPASATPAGDPFAAQACYPAQFPVPNADTCSTADSVANNQFNFVTKTFHLATANYAGDTTDADGVPHGLMQCPRMSMAVSVQPPSDLQDLSQCTAVDWAAHVPAGHAGWVNLRRVWSAPPSGNWENYHSPEHMLIAQQAASIAGFPTALGSNGSSTNPLFAKVFWMQYPVTDQYLATPIDGDPNSYVVGQSYRPVSFANVGAHASRGLYLPELAQMPDLSLSVWDWAAGNEICPIQGLDSPDGLNAFSSAGSSLYDVNNCHDFTKMLGPLNASHFKPGSKAYYAWYHQLALSRMVECSALAATVSPLNGGNVSGIDQNATYGTEAHECEREAMVYEMFAQHFLQDNWSTGHMWGGWGSPDLRDMPTTLPFAQWVQLFALSNGLIASPLTWGLAFPNENLAARRVITATILATLRGMIHGTKAVSAGQNNPTLNSILGNTGALGNVPFLTDDPLCGPQYPDITGAISSGSLGWSFPDALTSWSLQGGASSLPLGPRGVSPGAGDYYWSPDPSFGKVSILADDGSHHYQAQRDHLLACAAKSLRDVYLAGPQVHGALNPSTSVDGFAIDGLDPSGPDCWNNWATNDSMEGALAPLFYSRNWPGRPGNPLLQQGLQSLTPLFNAVISYMAVSATFGIAPQQNQYDQNWLKGLGALLATQSLVDNIVLEANMVVGAIANPEGTDVAQMSTPLSQKLTMLNMPSWTPPASGPPAYYADVATPRGSEADYPNDYVMRRMFWRSHLREMCAEVDADALTTLQARCINSAGAGGDPEACTACVETAEPQVPSCQPVALVGGQFVGQLGPSKCAALTGTSQPLLPIEWSATDFAQNAECTSCTGPANSRWQMVAGLSPSCISPQLAAIQFCTGTEGSFDPLALNGESQTFNGGSLLGDPNDVVILNTIKDSESSSACLSSLPDPNLPPPLPFLLKDTTYQVGLVHTEGSAITPQTIVTAYQLHRREADGQPPATLPGGQPECAMQVTFDSNAPWNDALPPISRVAPPIAANAQVAMFAFPYIGGPYDRGLGFCGTSQRFSLWDRSCSDVLTQFPELGVNVSLGSGLQADRALVGYGYEDLAFPGVNGEQEARCAVVEPRSDVASKFTHVCHSSGYVCNSGELCVPSQGSPPNVLYLMSW